MTPDERRTEQTPMAAQVSRQLPAEAIQKDGHSFPIEMSHIPFHRGNDWLGCLRFGIYSPQGQQIRTKHQRPTARNVLFCDLFQRTSTARIFSSLMLRDHQKSDLRTDRIYCETLLEYERKLSRARDQAIKATKKKSRSLANMPREAGVPLTAVAAIKRNDLLERTKLIDELRELTEKSKSPVFCCMVG